MITTLSLLGPQIGNVFSNIVTSLDGDPAPVDEPAAGVDDGSDSADTEQPPDESGSDDEENAGESGTGDSTENDGESSGDDESADDSSGSDEGGQTGGSTETGDDSTGDDTGGDDTGGDTTSGDSGDSSSDDGGGDDTTTGDGAASDGGDDSSDDGTAGGSGDTTGDTTPHDGDEDGVADSEDNCPNTINADQADADGDGLGDVCDGTPDGDSFALRLNVGTGWNFTDSAGNAWDGVNKAGFTPTAHVRSYTINDDIVGTEDDFIFSRLVYTYPQDLRWRGDVPNGTYTVRLYFVDNDAIRPSIFHINVQGGPIEVHNYKPMDHGGLNHASIVSLSNVEVVNDTMFIDFIHVEWATFIAGIEIVGTTS